MQREEYMRRAIQLAAKGAGWASPNPMVGAVIVKDGRIIGEGYHARYGDLHAERNALAHLTESAEGAEIYVTLEPCCHYGKQPPCTEAILASGIHTVYIGSRDPNPLVAGKGAAILREKGITVVEDFLREECDALNPVFFHHITTGKPYVVMKYAMTIDGKTATRTGASKWITGETARAHVQELRGRYASILVGIGTVLADDPMLNCRIEGAHQPLRVVLDSRLRIPMDCQLIRTAKAYPTLIVCAVDPEQEETADKVRAIRKAGAEVVSLPEDVLSTESLMDTGRSYPKVSVNKLLTHLGERKIDSVLVEGGGEVHDAFLREGAVQQVIAYIAPKLFGGAEAKSPVGGLGFAEVSQALLLDRMKVTALGEDIVIEAFVRKEQECLQE